jgi:hypothetical protein
MTQSEDEDVAAAVHLSQKKGISSVDMMCSWRGLNAAVQELEFGDSQGWVQILFLLVI